MNGMGIWMSILRVEDQIWINSLMNLETKKIGQQIEKEKVSMRVCLVGIMIGFPHAMWCELICIHIGYMEDTSQISPNRFISCKLGG